MQTRAAVMNAPGDVAVRTLDVPADDADLMIDVTDCGICGTDVHMYDGELDIDFPVIPGHEFVGVVTSRSDDGVTDARGRSVHESDPVTVVPGVSCGECWYCEQVRARPTTCVDRMRYGFTNVDQPPFVGGLSQRLPVCPGSRFYRLPDSLDPGLGLLAEPLSVATHALERAESPDVSWAKEGLDLGQTVAVHGVGPIGLLCVFTAAVHGAGRVVAIDLDKARLELAQAFGATDIVAAAGLSTDAVVRKVESVTDSGVGPDVVVETAGVPATLKQDLRMVRRGGTIVDLGTLGGETVDLDYPQIVRKQLDVRGSYAYPPSQFETALSLLDDYADDYPFADLLSVHVDLDDIETAYDAQASGDALRAVVHPNR